MTTATTEATKTKTALDWAGAVVTVLAVIALAVPVVYLIYAGSGGVTLSTSDDVNNLIQNGIIAGIVAAALGLLGLVLNIPGLMKGVRVGRVASALVSALVLVAALLGTFMVMMPRASALSTLKDKTQPFATSLRDNCQTPLTKLKNDEVTALAHVNNAMLNGDATDDALFLQLGQADATAWTADAQALQTGATKLSALTAPDPKYNDLLQRCLTDVKGQADFLTNDSGPNAIALPAPFSLIAPKVSGISLLKGALLVASGTSPLGKVPPDTAQTAVKAALTQILAASQDAQLNADAAQLVSDMSATLKDNVSPINVDTAAIIGQ